MKTTLRNVFHPEIKTTVILSDFDETRRAETGLTVWDWLLEFDNRRARRVLKRMDDSQPEAVAS
jgi:hypothetical protein